MSRGPFTAYVDESGDPGLETFDPAFPIFVLCVALYRTEEYLKHDLPALSRIKFEYWWHDAVVFHSYKMRKKLNPFEALAKPENAEVFMASIGTFFENSHTTLIAAAIHKPNHKRQYAEPNHPYNMALQFCMERVYLEVHKHLAPNEEVTFLFEERGRKEDALLKSKFDMFLKHNACRAELPFRACFANKDENIIGLQVADLAAYPIARFVETGNGNRKDWQAILPRIRSGPRGIDGYGLKVFP